MDRRDCRISRAHRLCQDKSVNTILTEELATKLRQYEGKWVALFGPDEAMEVVAAGDDAAEASRKAKSAGFEEAILYKVLPYDVLYVPRA